MTELNRHLPRWKEMPERRDSRCADPRSRTWIKVYKVQRDGALLTGRKAYRAERNSKYEVGFINKKLV